MSHSPELWSQFAPYDDGNGLWVYQYELEHTAACLPVDSACEGVSRRTSHPQAGGREVETTHPATRVQGDLQPVQMTRRALRDAADSPDGPLFLRLALAYDMARLFK